MPHYDEGGDIVSIEARYEYIARTIANFGRYTSNRPRDLFVDGDGSMYIAQIFDSWGRKEGFTQADIQNAIRKHMFHEEHEGGGLRFAVDNDRSGKLLVKVAPSRKAQQQANTGRGRVRSAPLAIANEAHPRGAGRANVVDLTEETTKDRIDKSLSELIADSDWYGYGRGGGRRQAQHASGRRRDVRPRGSLAASLGCSNQSADTFSLQTRIQRWLSWMVTAGYAKFSIEKNGDRLRLSEVVGVMARTRPEYGNLNEEELMQMLEEHDDVGRFLIEDGWLSKVPRERRQRRGRVDVPSRGRSPDRAAGTGRRSNIVLTPAADVVHRIHSRSRSRSPTGDTDEDDDLVQQFARVGMDGSGPPNLPPGEGWTEYKTPEGDTWFAYEGSRGKWMYCPAQGHTSPQLWPEDDD